MLLIIEIDVEDKKEFPGNLSWKEILYWYPAKQLVDKEYTCQYALFGKGISTEMLCMKIDVDETVALIEEAYGIKVKRLSQIDKHIQKKKRK